MWFIAMTTIAKPRTMSNRVSRGLLPNLSLPIAPRLNFQDLRAESARAWIVAGFP